MGLADNPLSGEIRRILYNQEVKRHLQGRFAENPPDFIYERASLFGTAGVSLARAWSCPLVVELNAPLAGEQATYRGATLADLAAYAERFTLSQADLVLVVSTQLREYALGLGADPQRVHVVPNGVDPSIFRPRVLNGRRTPSAAIACIVNSLVEPTSKLTGFGATASTTARICSGVRIPGAYRQSAPASE